MAQSRPFAYNPGSLISGTTQLGDLAIGVLNEQYTLNYGGVRWWNGPDEELGYVIAVPVSGNTQPTPNSGTTASVGFYRSKFLTNPSFLEISDYLGRKQSQPPFATTNDAYDWLTNQGYWTSFVPVTPTPTATLSLTPTLTPTVTQTPTPTDLSSITTYTISACTSLNVLVADLGPGAFAPGDVFYLDFTGSTATECYTIINKINATPTDGSGPISYYPTCADCIDGTTTTYTISGCTNLNVLVADLGPGAFASGDIFNMTFTGATPNGCYRIVNKIVASPTDSGSPLTFYLDCDSCEASLVTPTPTTTSTPTNTPTVTPTPSITPQPITGYSFNLIQLPYNFPATGNTIMNATSPIQTGTTNPNELTLNQRGIYFNSIDSDGVDRTSYFSQFTGQSVTITMTQTGSTAIYSGDSQAFKYWSGNTGTPPGVPGTGFVFGTNITVPGLTAGTGNAVIIQSASTNWVSGQTVYISAIIN